MTKKLLFIGLLATSFLIGRSTAEPETIVEIEKVPVIPENLVDLSEVDGFDATENGVLLYLSDGTGYYIEK